MFWVSILIIPNLIRKKIKFEKAYEKSVITPSNAKNTTYMLTWI
jgi:hypothetical protein